VATDAELLAADAEARAAALDVERSFIVQAPAGSGKTELLIQRYLLLLANVTAPEEVLAITFTRKAAAEMGQRVVAALQRAVAGQTPEQPHEQITHAAALAVLERDAAHGWALIENARRLRIQTLDSFCAGVVRQLPLTSGLAAMPDIIESAAAANLYRQAATATLDWLLEVTPAASAVERVLTHLDGNTALYVRYLSRMLQTRDQWLSITGTGEIDQPDAVRRRLEDNVAAIVLRRLERLQERLSQVAPPELTSLAAYAADNLLAAGKEEHAVCQLEGCDALPGAHRDSLPAWRGIAELLLTKHTDPQWRKQVTVREGFPPKDDGQKADWMGVIQRLAEVRGLKKALHETRLLPDPHYSDTQWQTLLDLFRVLPLAVSELKRVFVQQSACDYTEVSMAAASALGKADAPSDLALLLDYRIQHLLVDEMQDTSLSQYRMLETLTAGWEAGDGRTFFCVGDPMQSIYRFRNAEVGRFVQTRDSGLAGMPLESLILRRNFRSGEHLVHWFNTVFGAVLPEQDDAERGAVAYSESAPVVAHEGKGSYELHPLPDADVAEEGACTADLVETCLADSATEDLAVLVRSKTQLPELLAELRRRRIAYQAVEIDRLTDLPEIIDLLALARALSHRDDRAAWLALLRSPLIGFTWSDLHALVIDADDACVWDLLQDPAHIAPLSVEVRERLPAFLDELRRALRTGGLTTFRARVERAWFRLGGPASLATSDELANAYRFLDVLEKVERSGTLEDPAELQQHLEDERVSSAGDDHSRVQVMSMHKSKGLQFDHVILPSLARRTRGGQKSVLSWLNLTAPDGRNDLVVSPVGPAHDLDRDPLHQFIEAAGQDSEQLELDRLLYVACTRAKRSLHLVFSVDVDEKDQSCKPPTRGSLLSRLWPVLAPVVESSLGEQPAEGDRHDKKADGEDRHDAKTDDTVLVQPVLRRISTDWRLPDPEPVSEGDSATDIGTAEEASEIPFDWVGSVARDSGTIVHRWLQRLAMRSPRPVRIDPDDELTSFWAKELGVSAADLPQVSMRVSSALNAMLADEKGCWILDGNGYCELPLSGLWQGRVVSVVIDRILLDGDTHWIIDYKTGTHEGGELETFVNSEVRRYAQQLARYKALYCAHSDAPNVRCALYFPQLNTFREI